MMSNKNNLVTRIKQLNINYGELKKMESNMNIKLDEHPLDERGLLAFNWIPNGYRNLLDVGCSHAYFTRYFSQKVENVYGIDVEEEAVEIATKRYPKIKFKVSPAENIPYEKDLFDIVTMLDTFEHTQNEKKVLDELYRVIKPGGILIFTVPHKGFFEFLDVSNFCYNFPSIYKFVYFIIKKEFPKQRDASLKHRHYSLNEIENLFKGKFIINKVHRSGLFIYPSFWLLSNIINYFIPNCIFSRFLIKNCHMMMNIDYSISFGAFSYNMAIYANSAKLYKND